MRVGDREIPYSLVTGIDLTSWRRRGDRGEHRPDVPALANHQPADFRADPADRAERMGRARTVARPGDLLAMDFYVWEDPGQLASRMLEFMVAGSCRLAKAAAILRPTILASAIRPA